MVIIRLKLVHIVCCSVCVFAIVSCTTRQKKDLALIDSFLYSVRNDSLNA